MEIINQITNKHNNTITKTNKKFRIYAKKLFLTYSQVNTEVKAIDIIEQLRDKLNVTNFNYVIGKESHQDGGIHFHAIIIHHDKLQIYNPNQLDIEYQDKTYHGNYTPVKFLHKAVSYVCKHKDYITNLENLQDGQLLTAKEFIIQQVQQKGIEKALIDYYEKSPDKAIAGMSVSSLKKQFSDIEKLKLNLQLDEIHTPFTLDSFDIQPDLQNWIQNPSKTLVLIGNSAIGKTQFCKAFVKQNKLKTLVVSHKEDFKRLNNTYQAIIVDDANIHELEETQLLSLIDNQVNKRIRVLYDSVMKKANIIQLIAMNMNEFRKVALTLKQPRFSRRLLLQNLKPPFIINVNVNINNTFINNNINIQSPDHNTSNQDKFKQHQLEEQAHVEKTQKQISDILLGLD